MKILMDNWGFISVGKSKGHPCSEQQMSSENFGISKVYEIDGDREPLPK